MPRLSDKTDRSLLDNYVQTGRESAFTTLVERHQAMAFSTAYRICGNREEAQDILQQALIIFARRANELGEVRCLAAWLHRVVVLESQTSWRKSRKRRKREKMAAFNDQIAAEKKTSAEEINPILDHCLNTLSKKDRQVLAMHYLEGLPFKTISESLGGNAAAWQKRSVRALQKLANKLQSRGAKTSAIALGAFLASSRAEAGVSLAPILIKSMTQKALQKNALNVAGWMSKTALLMTMKTGITISLVTGFALAYGVGSTLSPAQPPPEKESSSTSQATKRSIPLSRTRQSREARFTLEFLEKAISSYDRQENRDPATQSKLQSLMFLVPESDLEEVLAILLNTQNHARFRPIVGAFFGRWGEIDPAEAYARAQEVPPFVYWAQEGAMITWLSQNPDEALVEIFANKNSQNRNFLSQFINYQCETNPAEAALLVDQIVKEWPEIDGHLVTLVANLWAQREPLLAAEWVASGPDGNMKKKLLSSMALKVAKLRGFDALTIADYIEDPKAKALAREKAIYWWGVTTGGLSLVSGKAKPYRDLSQGFPEDWTEENIRSFSFATMVNYTSKLPDLLAIASNDEQRMFIYEGALRGSAWSNPSNVREAAEQLPDSFADSEKGRDTLSIFITRWSEMDQEGAATWLDQQASGAKKDILLNALEKEESE